MIAWNILERKGHDLKDGVMVKPPSGCISNTSGSEKYKRRKMNRIINSCRHLTRISSNISTLFWFLVLIALVHCNTSIPPPQKRGKDTLMFGLSLFCSLFAHRSQQLSLSLDIVLSVVKVKLLYPSLLEAEDWLLLIVNYIRKVFEMTFCVHKWNAFHEPVNQWTGKDGGCGAEWGGVSGHPWECWFFVFAQQAVITLKVVLFSVVWNKGGMEIRR